MAHSLISLYENMGSRESSPDPITLPSSPPSGRKIKSARKLQPSTLRRKSRLSEVSRMTPSKEIVLDTPHIGPNDGSPWRIKVTVQAEHRDSPGKLATRTTSIPLRSPSRSPTKKRKPTPKRKIVVVEEEDDAVGQAKKPRGRKRKATPSAKAASPVKQSIEQPEWQQQEDDAGVDVFSEAAALEAEEAMQAMESSSQRAQTPPNNRRASARLTRLSAQWSSGTGRTQRLSRAREELDEALQDAVGDGTYHGDMTLSRAEDFTMVSLESLQTTKEASMLHNSQLTRSHLSTVREGLEPGEKSAVSVSYMPSSPPKQSQSAQYPHINAVKAPTAILSPWEPSLQRQGSLQSPFEPTSSARKRRKLYSPANDGHAAASTLRSLNNASVPTSSRSIGGGVPTPQGQWQREREAVSDQIRRAAPHNVVIVNDDVEMSGDQHDDFGPDDQLEFEAEVEADGDLRQTEASRKDIQQSQHVHVPQEITHDPVRSERVEDLFAHLPPKPLRSKIPRTWRRSSGMDFSYVDSPAHLPLAGTTTDRRHSTDGSGVLTPPTTDQSEEDVEEEAGTVDLQGEANYQLQSEFTQPETECTRYQDDETQVLDDYEEPPEHEDEEGIQQHTDDESSDNEAQKSYEDKLHRGDSKRNEVSTRSRNDSKSPLSEVNTPDAANQISARSIRQSSTRGIEHFQPRERGIMQGAFPSDVEYQPSRAPRSTSRAHDAATPSHKNSTADTSLHNSMPQQQNNKPRRRPPRRPTADLTELLGLASSPVKSAANLTRLSEVGRPAQQLRKSILAEKQMSSSRSQNAGGNPKTSADIRHVSTEAGSAAPPQFLEAAIQPQSGFISPPKLTHDPITGQPLDQPKRRGRRKRVGDQSQTETSMTDSFASSNNSQQQGVADGHSLREPATLFGGSADSARQTLLHHSQSQSSDLRRSAVSKSQHPRLHDQVLQSSAIKRKEHHLARQWSNEVDLEQQEQEHASKRRSLSDRPATGIDDHEYQAPGGMTRRSEDQEQILRESTTSRRITATKRHENGLQRPQIELMDASEDLSDEQDDSEQQRAIGHRRIISAVDTQTDMPDDEGTRQQVEQTLDEHDEESYEEELTAQAAYQRSYEENLNLDSPTKVKVNFNDTMSFGEHVDQTSSWLAEAKRRPALFVNSTPRQQPLPQPNFRPVALEVPQPTPEQKQAAPLPGLSLFSKLGSALWNAVPRSKEPTEIWPETRTHSVTSHSETRARTQTQAYDDSTLTTTLRSQLRSRYGVLSTTYPWTMSHQRTLHRMLNSALSGRHDTLVPSSGPFPATLQETLAKHINAILPSITHYKFLFTRQHAYVIACFFHLLVSADLIEEMKKGEVEFIGDETARACRGYFDPVRHGDDPVWTVQRGAGKDVVGFVDAKTGPIEVDFVVRALGDCVLSNDLLGKKRKILEEE